jgi:hypothetical protein
MGVDVRVRRADARPSAYRRPNQGGAPDDRVLFEHLDERVQQPVDERQEVLVVAGDRRDVLDEDLNPTVVGRERACLLVGEARGCELTDGRLSEDDRDERQGRPRRPVPR